MSAYAHQMEREFSARSLSSRGGSEVGSHYVIESGFYMTSFAATIFIGALVTVGVLFITLLIALTVMLQTGVQTLQFDTRFETSDLGSKPVQTAGHGYSRLDAVFACFIVSRSQLSQWFYEAKEVESGRESRYTESIVHTLACLNFR